jgi:hypothetical protein
MQERPKDQQQPLRAIDPNLVVEPGAPGPEARDLAIPPFVGGERGVDEGKPDKYGDEGGDGGSRRWGPPRADIDRPTVFLAAVAFAIALGAQILRSGSP